MRPVPPPSPRPRWLALALLAALPASASGQPATALPPELRLAILDRPAQGGWPAALQRCTSHRFELEPTPDRAPHEPPPGPHYRDLGFLAPRELEEPYRGLVQGMLTEGRDCALLGEDGPLLLIMASMPGSERSPEALRAAAQRRDRAQAARELAERSLPAAMAERGFLAEHRGLGAGSRDAALSLPGGVGWLGSTEAEIDQRVAWFERYVAPTVGPARRAGYEDEVRVPVQLEPFLLDPTEVSAGAFAAFARATGYAASPLAAEPGADPSLPAVWVDLADASAYCAWVGGRLPSAAEWELAARGTEARRFPWGHEAPDGSRANFCDLRCADGWATPDHDDGWSERAPVGSFPAGATPEGLLDMAGNAREWTATTLHDGRAAVKGGGYHNAYDDLIPADVRANPWDTRHPDLGFRCAYDPD
jgi:formylglycine-generating enzyme required for sulfatase activity